MNKTLLKAAALAAFILSATVFSYGQPPPPPTPPVKVKDNGRQKLRRITLQFMSLTHPTWTPAADNYYIPSDATHLRFSVELRGATPMRLRTRLEIRQLCPVLPDNPDIGVTRELEYFASRTPLDGVDIDINGGQFHLDIKVHPPEGGVPHAQPHCFENPDHLGGGPYEAQIFTSEGGKKTLEEPTGTQNDTLHVIYTQAFETTSVLRFERLKSRDLLAPDSPFILDRRRRP